MRVDTAKGPIVWIAMPKDDAIKDLGAAENYIPVDCSGFTEMSPVEAMTAAIAQLTLSRDQLQRMQS